MPHMLPPNEEAVSPSRENERLYRDALGKFATGVAVVTAATPDGPVGMTVNSFASVSLDPPLVLWSLERKSYRYPVFANAVNYAIHVLEETQAEMALDFARNANAFANHNWHIGENGVPLLDDTLARFECERAALHDGGDHTIVVGKVQRFLHRHGGPLVFASGKFGTVTGMQVLSPTQRTNNE